MADLKPVLELKNVSKTFVLPDGKSFQAVKNVNLIIPDVPDVGEFRVFLGPSGCGKSTAAWSSRATARTPG
jgi:ABC-type sugar transport system ATPase subunit